MEPTTKVYNIYMNLNLCMCVVGCLFFDIQPEDIESWYIEMKSMIY